MLAHPCLGQQTGFDAFKLVRTRNIFDPDRRPLAVETAAGGGAGAVSAPPTKSDYLALTGTLISPDKTLAFFSGSRDDYHKVLPVKEKIAGVTITAITPTGISVDRAGKTVKVAVGWTVPLDNSASAPAPTPPPDASAAPAVSEAPAAVAAATSASAPAAGAAPGAAPAAPAASPTASVPPGFNRDEVTRRMMEKRLQELK
jgi:hypothetical protein